MHLLHLCGLLESTGMDYWWLFNKDVIGGLWPKNTLGPMICDSPKVRILLQIIHRNKLIAHFFSLSLHRCALCIPLIAYFSLICLEACCTTTEWFLCLHIPFVAIWCWSCMIALGLRNLRQLVVLIIFWELSFRSRPHCLFHESF